MLVVLSVSLVARLNSYILNGINLCKIDSLLHCLFCFIYCITRQDNYSENKVLDFV